MWVYAVIVVGLAVVAELAGLGGIPAKAMDFENALFIVLLLAFAGAALRRFVRR
jgi:hypothetical protein